MEIWNNFFTQTFPNKSIFCYLIRKYQIRIAIWTMYFTKCIQSLLWLSWQLLNAFSIKLLFCLFEIYHFSSRLWARSIQPKFRPVRPGKEDHLKRWTRFFETFPVGTNRSIEFWTEISGNFGWMDRTLCLVLEWLQEGDIRLVSFLKEKKNRRLFSYGNINCWRYNL